MALPTAGIPYYGISLLPSIELWPNTLRKSLGPLLCLIFTHLPLLISAQLQHLGI